MDKLLFNGQIKTIPAWDVDSDRGWTILSGDYGLGIDQLYYLRVPWLYRGVEDRAQNVGAMPWAIFRGEVEVIDSGKFAPSPNDDLYFLRDITRLLELYEASMCMTGKCYFYLETNVAGYIKTIRYCAPNTVSEVYDNATGQITGYKRSVNGRLVEVPPANICAVYKSDYLTETGPGRNSAAGAAIMAAGALYHTEGFISQFFRRGAIKATILSADTNKDEADRLQHWWEDVVQGIKNAWAALVLRGKLVTPVVVGEGLESLQNMDLTTAQRQEISTAMGIPESRLWSSAANYATRREDELAYYRGTILPEWNILKAAFNNQVFTKEHRLDGYRIEPQPENLDVFQEDEKDRAGALQQLTGAGLPLKLAMELLGYDLTDAQWAMVDAQPKAQPMAALPAEVAPIEPMVPVDTNPAEVQNAIASYRRKCIHAVKRGERPADVEFTSSIIPARVMDALKYELEAATDEAGVKAAFEAVKDVDDHDPELAAQLKRANDILSVFIEARNV